MTISLAKINVNADKWVDVFNKYNTLMDTLATKVVTVNADVTNGNCTIGGRIIANEIFEGGERVVNSSLNIATGSGLSGGGNLSTNRTISLSSATNAKLAKAESALQTANFNGKLGLKSKISVPGDILAAGTANSTTFLSGVGTWVKIDNTPGDMLKLVFDPWGKNGNAFDMSYMVETNHHKIFTAAERNKLAGIDTKFNDITTNINNVKNTYVKRDGSLSITGDINTRGITMNGTLITNQKIQTKGIKSTSKVEITTGGLEVTGESKFNNAAKFETRAFFNNTARLKNTLDAPEGGSINIAPNTKTWPPTHGFITSYYVNRILYELSGSEPNNSDCWGSRLAFKNLTANREAIIVHAVHKEPNNSIASSEKDRLIIRIHDENVAFAQGNGIFWIQETLNANTVYSRNDIGAASDIKLKTNLEIIPNALNKIKTINGYTYDRIDNDKDKGRQAGLIAQEVEKILPEVVGSIDDTKFIRYGNLVSLLVEAIKELSNEVEDLKQRLK